MVIYPDPCTDFPPDIRAKIAAIDAELDTIHPGWRQKQRFDQAAYDLKARIKWLLKRRSLLGSRDRGLPAPRDWAVLIVPDGKRKGQCYAHPVTPVEGPREVTREPPPVHLTSTPTVSEEPA